MVLVGGGVAGGTAATPGVMGVPMLPAVLPPVLWGVTAGISKSPNPSNTWERETAQHQTNDTDYSLSNV